MMMGGFGKKKSRCECEEDGNRCTLEDGHAGNCVWTEESEPAERTRKHLATVDDLIDDILGPSSSV